MVESEELTEVPDELSGKDESSGEEEAEEEILDPEIDIPNNKKEERLHTDVYSKRLNVGDLLLIFFNSEYESYDSEVQDVVCEIESMDMDQNIIVLKGGDLYITELLLNDEKHIILQTDGYDIIDIEKIEESDESVEDIDLRLTKDIIKDIIFEVTTTEDKNYTDNEKKEELISELISLLNAYSNNGLIKEITDMSEYYLELIRECINKKIDNKETLTFVTDIINENVLNLPSFIKPIVSAKRNLYGIAPNDPETGQPIDLDSSIIQKSSEEEIIKILEDLELSKNYNYKRQLNIDMNNEFTNYQYNDNNVKFKTKYEGEYIRDCIDKETCYGVKIEIVKKSTFGKPQTVSKLHTSYSFDNVRTRNALIYPKLVAETTVPEILKDKEHINMVGLMLMPTNYLYYKNKLSLQNNLFSLLEITAFNKLIYSYEIFKERLKRETTLKKQISIDTNDMVLNDALTYYTFDTDTIDINTLGTLLKNNLPSKQSIISKIDSDIYNGIYDINNLERLLDNYDIKFKDLDTNLKKIVIDNIKDNVDTYIKAYSEIAKPKKIDSLKIDKKKLTEAERSKKALKYILEMINVKDKYNYLRKYIDLFLRTARNETESKNYFYNKYTDEKSICKHYEYLIDENKFDSLLNIWKSDKVNDGYICCKNCGEYLCPEGFSPLQGFSDGRPVNTNEKMEDDIVDEQTKNRKANTELINEIVKIFKVNLNIKDLDSVLDIFDSVDLNEFSSIRLKKKDIDDLIKHPYIQQIKNEYNEKMKTAKKKEKKKLTEAFNKEKASFIEYASQTNKILLLLYLIPLFVQTAVPSYNMKNNLEILDEKKLIREKLIMSKDLLNSGMLNYIEKTLRTKCSSSSGEVWVNSQKLLNESNVGLNNIQNNILCVFEYLKENFTIIKRINNYSVYLKSGGRKYFIKDSWSSYRPEKTNDMIIKINNQINDDKTFNSNTRMENNALLTEINNIKNTEKYKELGIDISEFMNNESYKRLLKYSIQLFGTTKKPLTMINLLINRLLTTLDKEKLEPLFKKIGWNDSQGMDPVKYNDLKNIIITEIPQLYKKDKESVQTFIHINYNNFDLRILSTRVNVKKIYSYNAVKIYPLDEYSELDKKKSPILDKIFSIYCRDEFGNIVIKNDKNYLDYLLLDYNTSEEIENNCDDKKSFTRNEKNFLSYLELLRKSHKLKFHKDKFKIYTPFYNIGLINQISEDNKGEFDPNNNLINFIKKNKYLEESNVDHELFMDINNLFSDPEYVFNTETKKRLQGLLGSLINKTDDLTESLFDSLEEIMIKNSVEPIFRDQLKRLEKYYNLKISGVGGVTVGKIKAGTIKSRMNTLFKTIIENVDEEYLDDIIEIKINNIKNIYRIVSCLKNSRTDLGTEFDSDVPFLWKITKTNGINFKEFMENKEFSLHENIFGENDTYRGFYEYSEYYYFIGLFDYIDGYKENIKDLIGMDSGKYAIKKADINYMINYILLFVLHKISEYIGELIVEGDDEENDVNKNALNIFEELQKDYTENKQTMIKECSRLLLDLVQNIIEEHNDVNYLHVNKEVDILQKQMGKQKEREKQFLVSELTGQSNEERRLTLEKQNAGLSNWFDNLSKQNEEYRNSEQFKTDTEEERLKRFKEISESFISEKEVYENYGLNYEDLLKQQIEADENLENKGYNDGKDEVERDIDEYEGENDELDGYDN